MKTIQEVIKEQATNPDKDEARKIISDAINNPTILLANGCRLVCAGEKYKMYSPSCCTCLKEGDLDIIAQMLVSMIVSQSIDTIEKNI